MKKKEQAKKVVKSAAKKVKTAKAANDKKSAATTQPVAPKRTPRDIPAADLQHAPWNPRSKITPESVADLTASIAKDGLIQRLVVVADVVKQKYTVIAGNRRLVACKAAGLDPIPCEVMEVTSEQAKRMTFLENLQRQDVDPILESDLIDTLIKDGMTDAEIAAETGRGERWVARRKNLRNLHPAWRKRAAAGNISTDCLEHVAAYPKDLQERCKGVASWKDAGPGGLRWCDCESAFKRESRELKGALFQTAECRSCPNNTGCAPELFDWSGKPSALGTCLCAKCYNRKRTEAVDAAIKSAKDEGLTVLESRPSYEISRSPKRTKTCTVMHVYQEYDGDTVIEWAEPEPGKLASSGASSEADKAEKAARKARNKEIRKLAEWCLAEEHLAKLLSEFFWDGSLNEIKACAPFYIHHAFRFSTVSSWKLVGTDTGIEECATAAMFNEGECVPPGCWTRIVAGEIIRALDPSKQGGWKAEHNAMLILAMLRRKREPMPVNADAIAGDQALDTLMGMTANWIKEDTSSKGEHDAQESDEWSDEEEMP